MYMICSKLFFSFLKAVDKLSFERKKLLPHGLIMIIMLLKGQHCNVQKSLLK